MGKRVASLITALAMTAFGMGTAYAYTPSGTVGFRLWSEYVLGNGIVAHEGAVSQNEVNLDLPYGFSFGAWHSFGLNGRGFSSDGGDEVDWTLSWAGIVHGFGVELGVTYLDLVDIFHGGGSDFVQPYAEVGREFKISDTHAITPCIRLEVLIPAGSTEGGTLLKPCVKHAWQISPLLTLNNKLYLVRDDGVAGLGSGYLGQYQGGLAWNVSEKVTLEFPSVKASLPFSSFSDHREKSLAVGAGLVYRF